MEKQDFENIKEKANNYVWALMWAQDNTLDTFKKDNEQKVYETYKELINAVTSSGVDAYQFATIMLWVNENVHNLFERQQLSHEVIKIDKQLETILCIE